MKRDEEELKNAGSADVALYDPREPQVIYRRSPINYYLIITFVVGGILATIAVLTATLFLFPTPPTTPKPISPAIPAIQFFVADRTETLLLNDKNPQTLKNKISDIIIEEAPENTFRRIVIRVKDGDQEIPATAAEILALFIPEPPQRLLDNLEKQAQPMLFVYFAPDGAQLGVAAQSRDLERTLRDMILLEPHIVRSPMAFGLTGENSGQFENEVYRNIDWRFLKSDEEGARGMAYGIFPGKHLLLITSGSESIKRAIDRLYDAR